jgi:hypothetical protein
MMGFRPSTLRSPLAAASVPRSVPPPPTLNRGQFLDLKEDTDGVLVESKEEKGPTDPFPVPIPYPDTEELKAVGPVAFVRSKGMMGKIDLPPRLQSVPNRRHTFRFRCSSSSAINCGIGGFLGAVGAVATSSSTASSYGSTFRIHRITAWPPGNVLSAQANVRWSTTAFVGYIPDESWIENLPDGITVTRSMTFVPPKRSLACDWLASSLGGPSTVCTIQCAIGTILDVDLEVREPVTIGGIAFTAGLTGLLPGSVYYLPLDGPVSNTIKALGVPTI